MRLQNNASLFCCILLPSLLAAACGMTLPNATTDATPPCAVPVATTTTEPSSFENAVSQNTTYIGADVAEFIATTTEIPNTSKVTQNTNVTTNVAADVESSKSVEPFLMNFLTWKESLQNPLPDKGLLGVIFDKNKKGEPTGVIDTIDKNTLLEKYQSIFDNKLKSTTPKPTLAPDLKKAYILLVLQDALLNKWTATKAPNLFDKATFLANISNKEKLKKTKE